MDELLLIALSGLGCPEDEKAAAPLAIRVGRRPIAQRVVFAMTMVFVKKALRQEPCSEDADCPCEEICVKPDGVEFNCVYPHDCDEDADCNDPDKICIDADDDGYRDCVYDSCTDDAMCRRFRHCSLSDEPRCIAGACICVDYCGNLAAKVWFAVHSLMRSHSACLTLVLAVTGLRSRFPW